MKKTIVTIAAALVTISLFAEIRALTHDDYGKADAWQRKRHAEKMDAIASGGAKVVFIGDSITHNWENVGGETLAELRNTYSVLNIGYGSDRTQHLLWRGEYGGELDGYKAKCVMLMVGTNNTTDRNSAEDTAKGVKKILELIARKQPQAKTLLLPIFPRGDAKDGSRATNEKVNEIIKGYADGRKVVWVDFNAKFLDENGDTKWVMPDRLHPNARGYAEIWLPAVLPHFKDICRPEAKAKQAEQVVASFIKRKDHESI